MHQKVFFFNFFWCRKSNFEPHIDSNMGFKICRDSIRTILSPKERGEKNVFFFDISNPQVQELIFFIFTWGFFIFALSNSSFSYNLYGFDVLSITGQQTDSYCCTYFCVLFLFFLVFYFIMAQFCSVHIHAKNNEKDLFITVHHGFQFFHYLVNVLNKFSSYFIMVFIYIFTHNYTYIYCSLFCHCL